MDMINHNLAPSPYMGVGVLVPFGYFFNKHLLDIKVGDKVSSIDGLTGVVKSKTVLLVNSDVANAISLLLYGLNMSVVHGKMVDNWGEEIYEDEVLFIVLENETHNKTQQTEGDASPTYSNIE